MISKPALVAGFFCFVSLLHPCLPNHLTEILKVYNSKIIAFSRAENLYKKKPYFCLFNACYVKQNSFNSIARNC